MKIGILASGGDSVGMNYCLFKLCKMLSRHKIVLFQHGFLGLINNEVCNFTMAEIKSKRNNGGIIIKSSRSKEFMEEQGFKKALNTLKKNEIDVLIVMGGNGSLKGTQKLLQNKIKVIFIPCTVDNDIAESEYCIGFNTACDNCINFIKNIDFTMKSSDKTCIYETMGRKHAHIALAVGNAINADYLYADETCTKEKCIKAVKNALKTNPAPIVILRENILNIDLLKTALEEQLNIQVRTCIIGYVQRGGMATKYEKYMATNFAKNVKRCILNKKYNVGIFVKNNKFIPVDLLRI